MAKFNDAKFLYINLTHFLIYSARYGIRRDCSHIVIRPPFGCNLPAEELKSALVQLPDLDPNKEERKRKKSILSDYFVGDVTLDYTVKFPINLDDVVVSKWMDVKEDSCLRIELFSSMISPNTQARQSLISEPMCFGYINIPLAGLLCTETLDAVVNCEIQVEANTHASVLSRMRSMPYSHTIDFSKQLGMKMGHLSLRLFILDNENNSNFKKNNEKIFPLTIPQYDDKINPYPIVNANGDNDKDITAIDSALAYSPVEQTVGKNLKIDSIAYLGIIFNLDRSHSYCVVDDFLFAKSLAIYSLQR
jgi:hypothetical protein